MNGITPTQQAWIDSLHCIRLKEWCDEEILDFENTRNPGIVQELFEGGKQKDLYDEESFYLIRDGNDKPLFFFSVKCGLLEEKEFTDEYKEMVMAYCDKRVTPDVKERIDNFQADNSLSDKDLCKIFTESYRRLKKLDKNGRLEKGETERGNVRLVMNTYPAIEISYICRNENAPAFRPEDFGEHRMGEIFFWRFIVDKIKDIRNLIGAKYVYLFAADDNKEQETLIAYYSDKLHFAETSQFVVLKPSYDINCRFMCAHIADLIDYQNTFFAEFNKVLC